MSYEKNGDFKKYYDTTQKRNYWVLGYFGGGSINVIDAYSIGGELSDALNVPMGTVQIDEIRKSSRYKSFKIVYSLHPNQKPEADSEHSSNVWELLSY